MNVLFIGDIVGKPGRKAAKEMIKLIHKEMPFDYCIANGENAAGCAGITCAIAKELYEAGVDVLTLGNHTWSKKEITSFIDTDPRIIRPANYHQEAPGKGFTIVKGELGVINLQGRIFMDPVDCPFRSLDRELEHLKENVKAVFVDMHGEATSEKSALAWYADGRVSCVIGTHTHVQSADERILPRGTAFLTDAGMTGPYDGIIGVEKETILKKFIYGIPARFEPAKGTVQFNGVHIKIEKKTGKALEISRIFRVFDI